MGILVTGASGFVGSNLLNHPLFENEKLVTHSHSEDNLIEIKLSKVETVIHLAGISVLKKEEKQIKFFNVNSDYTKFVFEKSIACGIKHFIFISSIKALGDTDGFISNEFRVTPIDAYGKSKLKAEEFILNFKSDEIKVSIIRPVLIYGKGVKGNLLNLMKLLDKNLPLPFYNIKNKRSILSINNLVKLIYHIYVNRIECQINAADLNTINTSELVGKFKHHLNSRSIIFSLPYIFHLILRFIAKSKYDKLFSSSYIDPKESYLSIGFTPLRDTDTEIIEMIKYYKKNKLS